MSKLLFASHLNRVIGTAFYFTALFIYRSPENRPIFGLWSYKYFILIVISGVVFILLLISSWISLKREVRKTRLLNSASTYFDLAILFWGVAYFLSAVDLHNNACRIADLNIVGSTTPLAIMLEWFAMLLLFIAGVIIIVPKSSNKWKNPILMFFTIGALLLVSEGIIRFRAIISPISQGFPTYTSILWGRYNIDYNRKGFRDIEHTLDKPPGTSRLLTIGDSFAFGWGLNSIEDRFGEQLAAKLQEKRGSNWESINASDYDTHTLDHIEFLKRTISYEPDIIILIYVFNDIDYLSSVTPRPDFYSRLKLTSILFRNFYLFQEAYFRFRMLKVKYKESNDKEPDPYIDTALVSKHLKDISEFIELGEKNGALVWVVPFDISIVSESHRNSRYKDFVVQLEAAGIPVISLEAAFEKFEFSKLKVNKYDSHPNGFANRIAAEKAAYFIVEKTD